MKRRIAAAAIVALSVSTPATALAAAPSAAAPGQRSCSVLIDRHGHTLQTVCATGDRAPALRGTGTASLSRTKLMTWFSDAQLHGDHTDIYGNAGDCDSSGYSVVPDSWWQRNMSSIMSHNHCNTARLINHAGDATVRNLSTSFGGTPWNDSVIHVRVYRH
ncbi:hypothetical protein [Actinomadura litoris]|uniref:hypothetical protein n=1 Tax=Actinomadura litoris TaxID=2678616 RepID=UPI001FA6C593|nr:hypothetical protein [Actinomadura litoris]